MSGSQRTSGLRDKVQDAVRRQGTLALDDTRQGATRHKLHHQVRGVILLAVVEHVRHAGVVQQRRIASLRAETLQEAGVAGVLFLQDLDRNDATKHLIASLPHLTHTANCDTLGQGVAPAQGNISRRPHLFNTASKSCLLVLVANWAPVATSISS